MVCLNTLCGVVQSIVAARGPQRWYSVNRIGVGARNVTSLIDPRMLFLSHPERSKQLFFLTLPLADHHTERDAHEQ